jgi:hypothetical protein
MNIPENNIKNNQKLINSKKPLIINHKIDVKSIESK